MRKAFLLVIILVLSVFTGCSSDADKIEIKIPYKCNLNITSENENETNYKADFIRNQNGWTMKYSSPESLEGLKIEFKNNKYKINIGEVTVDAEKEDLPDGSVCSLIVAALDNASLASNVKFETNDGVTVAKGIVNNKDYEIEYKDNKPVKLKTSKLIINISDFEEI